MAVCLKVTVKAGEGWKTDSSGNFIKRFFVVINKLAGDTDAQSVNVIQRTHMHNLMEFTAKMRLTQTAAGMRDCGNRKLLVVIGSDIAYGRV